MRRPIIAGNWKMNKTVAEALELVEGLKNILKTVDDVDIEKSHRALDCYVTFKETIEKSRIKDFIGHEAMFEIFGESHDPPLRDLFDFPG